VLAEESWHAVDRGEQSEISEAASSLVFLTLTTVEEYELRGQLDPNGPEVKLVHLAYQPASHELATKTFDFSPSSIADRWTAGRRNMASGLDLIANVGVPHLALDISPSVLGTRQSRRRGVDRQLRIAR
jgi:hypothetical protein